MTVEYQLDGGPNVTFQAFEDQRIRLYVQTSKVRNRGKVILAMEEVRVIRNGPLVVEVFEWTIEQTYGFRDGMPDSERDCLVKAKWTTISLEITYPDVDDAPG